jgi:hypothetical protein
MTTDARRNSAQLPQRVSTALLFWTEKTLDKMPRIGLFCITLNAFSGFDRYLDVYTTTRRMQHPKQLTLKISPESKQRLKEAAAQHEVTVSDLIRTALADRYGVKLTA